MDLVVCWNNKGREPLFVNDRATVYTYFQKVARNRSFVCFSSFPAVLICNDFPSRLSLARCFCNRFPIYAPALEFGRFARREAYKRGEKPKEFTFLGFTHYCGKTKRGYFKVKRRTDRKKMGQSLRRFSDWAKNARNRLSKGEMLRRARTRVTGHLNYYAITDNADQCDRFIYYATRLLFKWLNRKSQRRAYTWEGFNHALKHVGWPKPRIRIDLSPFRRAEAH